MKIGKGLVVRSLWTKVGKLERQIENTAIESPADGFAKNMFESYDREDLTEELLQVYDQMKALDSKDGGIIYRYAGALLRARRFEQARTLYAQLLSSNTSSHLMLAMLELMCGNKSEAEKRLTAYNQRCVAEGMPFMQSTIEKLKTKRE